MSTSPANWPRLSQSLSLFGELHPDKCQSCGSEGDISLWREHDEQDRPEQICVALCQPCSDQLIEPHPRLYALLPRNIPWPGAMALCTDCRFRQGLACTHSDLMVNGGAGLVIKHAKPYVTFLDGTNKAGRRMGWQETVYPAPPTECAGKEGEKSARLTLETVA